MKKKKKNARNSKHSKQCLVSKNSSKTIYTEEILSKGANASACNFTKNRLPFERIFRTLLNSLRLIFIVYLVNTTSRSRSRTL